MEIWTIGLPTPLALALAVVAVVAYWIGARRRARSEDARRELKRARSVIRELEGIAQQVRKSLAAHHSSVNSFKDRIEELSKTSDSEPWRELSEEAERMLKPTLQLSNQIAHAYDEIRQQTNLLMTFTEVRTDPLTGLRNRRALDESLVTMFALMSRYDSSFSIAIFDIDHFKRINDEQGHTEGDNILQQVARQLDDCIRDTDMVARFGGEEFVVVMPETDLEGAEIFAERARRQIEDNVRITVSGGIAMALDGDNPRTLLARADSALYSAKSAGRNFVFLHSGNQIEPVGDRDPVYDYQSGEPLSTFAADSAGENAVAHVGQSDESVDQRAVGSAE
ncbi:MAG: GGDEF domain-containing protein [Pirellulaceae bacterium]|nr:GGDEF domain-containing protein [Pirellulaceae bacterium]